MYQHDESMLPESDLPFQAERYRDEIARLLIRMSNGRISVENSLRQIINATIQARTQLDARTSLVTPEERVAMVLKDFDERVNGTPTGAVPTHLPCLDYALLGGLPPAETAVIAGLPGSGKSVMLQQIAESAARKGFNVVFIAAEMQTVQLSYRTLARLTGIDSARIRMNELTDNERGQVRREITNLKSMKIMYKDAGDMSTTGIYESVLEAQQKFNGPVHLVVCDYLQILQDDKGFGNENLRLETISRVLKSIAQQFNIPVLVGSQINRESVKAGTRPGLHHLRGSGAIGQDASIVLLLHPDYDPDEGEKGDVEKVTLIVEKNRNGRSGLDILCTFDRTRQLFNEFHAKHQGALGALLLKSQGHQDALSARGF